MDTYCAELTIDDGEGGEGWTEERFEASSDEEALAAMLAQHPDELQQLNRVGGDGSQLVIWERNPSVYLKYIADGAETLDQVIAILREQADEFERMQAEGLTLDYVDGGYVILTRAND